jgi:hypothetical protein
VSSVSVVSGLFMAKTSTQLRLRRLFKFVEEALQIFPGLLVASDLGDAVTPSTASARATPNSPGRSLADVVVQAEGVERVDDVGDQELPGVVTLV